MQESDKPAFFKLFGLTYTPKPPEIKEPATQVIQARGFIWYTGITFWLIFLTLTGITVIDNALTALFD